MNCVQEVVILSEQYTLTNELIYKIYNKYKNTVFIIISIYSNFQLHHPLII